MRSNPNGDLGDAIQWFKDNNIPLLGVNENPNQWVWTKSPKPYGHFIIDDTAVGCPLITTDTNRPYVDWFGVTEMLNEIGVFENDKKYSLLLKNIEESCYV